MKNFYSYLLALILLVFLGNIIQSASILFNLPRLDSVGGGFLACSMWIFLVEKANFIKVKWVGFKK